MSQSLYSGHACITATSGSPSGGPNGGVLLYTAVASVLAYHHRLPMPLEYFVYLPVGLMHFACNCREFWTMLNLYALPGVQQGFRHELATNYAFLIHLKQRKL